MLDHRRERDGHDGDDGSHEQIHVAIADQGEDGVFHLHRQADPRGAGHAGEIHAAGDGGVDIGDEHAQQNRDDAQHALAPDVEDDHRDDSDKRDIPAAGAVIDGGVGQRHADADDDRAGDDGREEPHDAVRAEAAHQRRQNQIQQAGSGDAHAGIGEKRGLAVRRDGGITGQIRERTAQKSRNLTLREEVEKERAQTGEQQRRGDGQPRQRRHEHACAKHGEHVLKTQNEHFRRAQRARVADTLVLHGDISFVNMKFARDRTPRISSIL